MPDQPNPKLYKGAIDPPTAVRPGQPAYAELDVTTNFSFLTGASHPDEMVFQAADLGYRAMAITDVNSVAGVVRAYEAARRVAGFKLVVGTRLVFNDGSPDVLVWPVDRAAYARLCQLLTLGRRRAPKGECHLGLVDFLDHADGLLAAVCPPVVGHEAVIRRLHEVLGDRLSLAVSLRYGDDDGNKLAAATHFSARVGVPLLATNHVHYHDPGRRSLQDVLTCVRHKCSVHVAGYKLFANAERYLKSPRQMRRLFQACPAAIDRALQIAATCTFDLGELRYDYPTEAVPPGVSPSDHLRQLTYDGAVGRYPDGIPPSVAPLLEKELKFICGSKYESYFLTVHDIVRYARSRGILCQGRGSAANSAVCYCLGVTSIDPAQFTLTFERFASAARNEPPDIDIDFEHERREEIIQYVYQKYGRHRAAMTASLITYRGRSAVRDVGKALGFSLDVVDTLAGKLDWWHDGTLTPVQLVEAGVDAGDAGIMRLIALSHELLGFPRHLSQHVGGLVISKSPLADLVPIENASMVDRTVIEWDKDDLDVLGLFKVDILALGMLTCISKALVLIGSYGPKYELHTIPAEDPETYEMIKAADTLGVFQIESRAQMAMLPRLRPERFYDLVIEVAIVRPGPIQGKMVHPYLQRRERLRRDPNYKVDYPKPELADVLGKTLGVPLFQEQAMRMSMVAAGFSPEDSDRLRRAMAAWKRGDGLGKFRDKFINGMLDNGYEPDYAERCFQQISGFGEYGFPESHAASFALLVYASCWIKRHHPGAFAAALLNSQPMGFYAPAQIVRDAKEHGVPVLAVDVNASNYDCALEWFQRPGAHPHKPEPRARPGRSDPPGVAAAGLGPAAPVPSTINNRHWGLEGPAVRLGFRVIKGMREKDAVTIVAARDLGGPFVSSAQLRRRTGLNQAGLHRLAAADALRSMDLSRRQATWDALGAIDGDTPLLDEVEDRRREEPPLLPFMTAADETVADYNTTGLTLRKHPVYFARPDLNRFKIITAAMIQDARRYPHGAWVGVAGLVLVRQRPGTASGVVFVTLEDETGTFNLVIWSDTYDQYRAQARHAVLLHAEGYVQRSAGTIHVVTHRMYDRTPLLKGISQTSRDFH